MEEKNFVICDNEREYGIRFMERVQAHAEFYVQVRWLSSVEEAVEFLKRQRIYILLIGETFSLREREKIDCDHCFVLVGEGDCDLAERETAVRKYQPAEDILREILEKCLEHQEASLFRLVSKERRIIGFYSPVQSTAQTRMALALGKEIARKKEVLYLNFQPYSGWYQEEENYRGLSELIYYIRQGDQKTGIRAGTICRHIDGMSVVMPMENGEDLKMVAWEEWETLLEQICSESKFEVILLDLSECVQGLLSMLELCKEIYMQNASNEEEEERILQFQVNMRQMGKAHLLERIRFAEE